MMKISKLIGALGVTALLTGPAFAQDAVKVGLIIPSTGPFASTGRQLANAAKLYMQEHGDKAGGKKIELIIRDDTGVADVTKRIAQELIVSEKVNFLAGFGLTPLAFAVAPLATEAKTPMVVMVAGTSSVTEASQYIVRTSWTVPQYSGPMADWAFKNGIKSVMTIVTDFGPGHDAEGAFGGRFKELGGKVDSLRVPLRNPDFSPFLQRAADAKPDAIFVFVPSGPGAQFMKQFKERGLDKSGIKLIGTGDLTDDDLLNDMGDVALGVVTAQHYSADHKSPANEKFVAGMKKIGDGKRPNFIAVAAYDGMHVIYEALNKTKGSTDGTALVEAMKGMKWESPRGPISIDPETRDIIQNVYIRKVEKVNGELYNVEFDTIKDVKDPVKAAKAKK